ncbi:MAG: c-type cytochrome [Saprospiraceae bacterium]|nr:c-type cytochrome [Saprospiraceae bacterium]
MKNISIQIFGAAVLSSVLVSSCSSAGGDDPGTEYMPDMFHSIAYEANIYDYYYYNTWGTEDEYKKYAEPRKPVKGTIPRGYFGLGTSTDAETKSYYQAMPVNGFVPYYYEDTEEERTRAMEEITRNPYPITSSGLTRGKELYDIYCGICHGPKADGAGYLVREDGGVYPAQPANFLLPEFVSASEGRYYHAIMYGKNVMGGYADKLSYEERWQVIHYIRSLQAKEAKLQYSETKNTFNNTSIPGSLANSEMASSMEDESMSEDHGDMQMEHDQQH